MAIWLAGNRITATKLNEYSTEQEDTTAGRTTTSTTFTDLSGGAFSASVTVPFSGTVLVTIRCTQRNSTTNNSITSFDASGSVSGSVYSASTTAAVIVTNTNNFSLTLQKRLTGLVAGETLTVTSKHRVNAASTLTADYRIIILESVQ